VVIGGGSLAGGQGSIVGSLLGALLLTFIGTGCTHVGVPNWIQEILTGIIIIVAMGLNACVAADAANLLGTLGHFRDRHA